jgi:hypothetical protein
MLGLARRRGPIDGFWSLIKRGIMGTFHKVSAKYLPLIVAELKFRHVKRLAVKAIPDESR